MALHGRILDPGGKGPRGCSSTAGTQLMPKQPPLCHCEPEDRSVGVGPYVAARLSSRGSTNMCIASSKVLVTHPGGGLLELRPRLCSQHKFSRQALVGLLQPLPVPCRPWFHIFLDFITALPCSKGNSVILTIINRFSTMAHFLPLQKLPSPKEIAELLIQHIFYLHWLPMELQFSSVFCSEFRKSVGATHRPIGRRRG